MAVVMTMRWAGVTPEQYDELRDIVAWDVTPVPGALYHCAAFDDQGIRVTDVWERAEDFDHFVATRLMPGVHKVGVLGEPAIEIHPAHSVWAPAYSTGPGAASGDLEKKLRYLFDEAINSDNLGVIDELMAPGYVSHVGSMDLDRDAFKGFVADWRTGFPDVHCAVENVVLAGDRMSWTVRATGTHTGTFMGIPATGNKVDFQSVNQGRANPDGSFAEHWVVMDTTLMLQQMGVIPEMAPPA
jgi:predicted ester cyclase